MNKVINLKYNHESNGTILKTLAFFYLLVGSSYTNNLLSGQLDSFIRENRAVQHFIAFTLLVTIFLLTTELNMSYTLIYSTIIYFWFLLTTKLDLKWNVGIILLIFSGFIYEKIILDKEKLLQTDETLDKTHLYKIKQNKKFIQKLLVGGIFGLTVIGSYFYYTKQQIQHGGSFNDIRYLFG